MGIKANKIEKLIENKILESDIGIVLFVFDILI